MTPKNFRNFIAYQLPDGFCDSFEFFEQSLNGRQSTDPTGGSWYTVGFVELPGGEFYLDLQGSAWLFFVQFNERILPGAVRDEHVAKRVAELEERQGYKVNRKLYAQLKDDVTFDLLPKAFIRRSIVPVFIITPNILITCTSSHKKSQEAIDLLGQVFADDNDWRPALMTPQSHPVDVLTRIAQQDPEGARFVATDAAVLKGADKETIRIRDRTIGSEEVQTLLKDEYQVHELGLDFFEDGYSSIDADELTCTLIVNDKLIFKRVQLPAARVADHMGDSDEAADLAGLAWLFATEFKKVTLALFSEMGSAPVGSTAQTDDEDEL
ncbi:MAG: recombination-associated protein RdgC [Chromatiales bacterium]|nr:recombination-associated protein RdgC [Chromatiales bacterium]